MQPLVESLTVKMNNFFARYEDPVKSGLNVKKIPSECKKKALPPFRQGTVTDTGSWYVDSVQ